MERSFRNSRARNNDRLRGPGANARSITNDRLRGRGEQEALKEQRHRQALALLEVARQQQSDPLSDGGFGSSLGRSLGEQQIAAPGAAAAGVPLAGAVALDPGKISNAGFASLQRNASSVAGANNSRALNVPFSGGTVAASARGLQQPGIGGARTISNQPINAASFNAGEEATDGPIADDGGHNRRQSGENREPSRVEIAALRAKYRSIVIAGRATGYNFAASNLNHWLSGNGGTRNVSWNWLKKQGSFQVAYEKNIRTVERGIELLEGVAASNGRNGKDAGASGNVPESSIVRPSGRSDFFYGAGDSRLDTTAKITVTIKSGGKLVTNVELSHRWYDHYDWNRGSFARIEAPWGLRVDAYDDDANKLKAAGHGADYLLESIKKEHWR